MKALSIAFFLMASMAFVMLGCSDSSAPVAGPTDQAGLQSAPAPLEKVERTDFTAIDNKVTAVEISPGDWKFVGNRLIISGMEVEVEELASDPRMAGLLHNICDCSWSLTTGEGPLHGKFTLRPAIGGVWAGSWEGYRTMTGPEEFTHNLKIIGHGTGGTIDGMKFVMTGIYHASADPPYGEYEGYIQSH